MEEHSEESHRFVPKKMRTLIVKTAAPRDVVEAVKMDDVFGAVV
jgi:hypothetical protein